MPNSTTAHAATRGPFTRPDVLTKLATITDLLAAVAEQVLALRRGLALEAPAMARSSTSARPRVAARRPSPPASRPSMVCGCGPWCRGDCTCRACHRQAVRR